MIPRKLIVTVCRGNISRSPVAAGIIQNELTRQNLLDQYEVISRGTQSVAPDDKEQVRFPNLTYYDHLYDDSKPWLEEHGIDLSNHTSTPIDKETAECASVMLAMDRKIQQTLITMFPDQAIKVHLLSDLIDEDRDIIDPEGVNGKEAQEKIFSDMETIIVTGFPKLIALTELGNETTREIIDTSSMKPSSARQERLY